MKHSREEKCRVVRFGTTARRTLRECWAEREGGLDATGWLLGTQATLIRRCHVVLMSAEAFANLISRGGARRPLI